jgi:hypothetical protein
MFKNHKTLWLILALVALLFIFFSFTTIGKGYWTTISKVSGLNTLFPKANPKGKLLTDNAVLNNVYTILAGDGTTATYHGTNRGGVGHEATALIDTASDAQSGVGVYAPGGTAAVNRTTCLTSPSGWIALDPEPPNWNEALPPLDQSSSSDNYMIFQTTQYDKFGSSRRLLGIVPITG